MARFWAELTVQRFEPPAKRLLNPIRDHLPTEIQGQPRGPEQGNPEVRFLCWIKAGGQVRPRLNHTAPQRGAVQGLSGFWTAPCAGVTFGPLGSQRGSGYAVSPATSRFVRGSRRGCSPQNRKNAPAFAGGIKARYRSEASFTVSSRCASSSTTAPWPRECRASCLRRCRTCSQTPSSSAIVHGRFQ